MGKPSTSGIAHRHVSSTVVALESLGEGALAATLIYQGCVKVVTAERNPMLRQHQTIVDGAVFIDGHTIKGATIITHQFVSLGANLDQGPWEAERNTRINSPFVRMQAKWRAILVHPLLAEGAHEASDHLSSRVQRRASYQL